MWELITTVLDYLSDCYIVRRRSEADFKAIWKLRLAEGLCFLGACLFAYWEIWLIAIACIAGILYFGWQAHQIFRDNLEKDIKY